MSTSTVTDKDVSRTPPSTSTAPLTAVCLPLLVALVALAGSLWLSMGMRLKACPLCFYQRTFVMGVVAVLGVGVLTGERYRAVLNLLALPLAVAGFGVAAFHVFLELTGKLECPSGVMGIGTAPQQSLAVLTVLLALVVVGIVWSRNAGESFWFPLTAAVVLGLLLAWGAVVSSPPMPPTPTKAYETPLDMCRPPFRTP
jgi:disulfide bond formation protein DsbB